MPLTRLATPPTGWAAHMTSTVTVYQQTGMNDNAEPTYDSGTSVAARVVQQEKKVRSPTGELLTSTCSIYVQGSVSVAADDKVKLPDTSEVLVIGVKTVRDVPGNLYLKVIYT